MSLSSQLNASVQLLPTAQAMWDHLQTLFQDTSLSTLVALTMDLRKIQLQDFPSMAAYLERIKYQCPAVGRTHGVARPSPCRGNDPRHRL